MWKIALGFVVFAAVAVWMLSKGGDIDMGGEKHEINVPHAPESSSSSVPAPAAVPAAPAAAGSAPKL